MSKELHIGIDIATENVRAVAIDKSGTAFAQASAPLAKVIAGDDKRLTQDVRSWVGAVSKVLSQIGKQLSEKQLRAVSL
ncbi:MAG: FGGY family carbohydrate kinase, partial [Candidatus Nanopelagicus sp.]